MKANVRLHKTIESYAALIKEDGCFSYNGEYSAEVEKKVKSIIKQCAAMEKKKDA